MLPPPFCLSANRGGFSLTPPSPVPSIFPLWQQKTLSMDLGATATIWEGSGPPPPTYRGRQKSMGPWGAAR